MPRKITLTPYSFPVTDVYSDGARAIGPEELRELDVLRAEKIRKRAWKELEKLRKRGGRRVLSEPEEAELAEKVRKLDAEVKLDGAREPKGEHRELPMRESEPGDEQDSPGFDFPIAEGSFAASLRRLAEARIEREEALRGIQLTEEQRRKAIRALESEPAMREAARRRLEVELAEKEKAKEDLGLGETERRREP